MAAITPARAWTRRSPNCSAGAFLPSPVRVGLVIRSMTGLTSAVPWPAVSVSISRALIARAAASPRTRAYLQPTPPMDGIRSLSSRPSRFLLVVVRGDQRRVHVDHQPACQQLPGDGQPREPGRGRADQRLHVRPDRGQRPGDLVQRPEISQLQRPPHRGIRRRGPRRPVPGAPAGRCRSCWRPQRDRHRH